MAPIQHHGLHEPGQRAGRVVAMAGVLDAMADGSTVFVSGGAAAPLAVDRAMAEAADRWSSLTLVCDRLIRPLAVFDHPGRPFHLVTLQPSPAVDGMRLAGELTTVALPFSRFGSVMARTGSHPIDVAVVHVSPPGPDGRFSLGVSVATPLAAMASARLVIAQVNPRMPYTNGFGRLSRDHFDLLVEVEHNLVTSPPVDSDRDGATLATIGASVADLIPNGATVQIGIGAVADAVLGALSDHRNLSIHSGMISDGVVRLAAAGGLAGSNHPRFPGKIVAGLVGGGPAVFDFVDNNPDVMMVPVALSHGQAELQALPDFRAVNSAVEVDLTGAVNGEVVGHRVVSGPGGAPDYAMAASTSPTGRFIVALPATAKNQKVSRITAAFAPHVPTTVAGPLVSAVVTEFGVADLGVGGPEARATALRAVAAPAFRSGLG